MQKFLLLLCIFLTTIYINAETVASTLWSGLIRGLPKVGQVVKKGEILVTFDTTDMDGEIKALKILTEKAKEWLKTKNFDKERANKLVGQGITQNEWEEIMYEAAAAKLSLAQQEILLKKSEFEKTRCFIYAPYDCKVTKVYLMENSGTDIGDSILEIERLN